MPEYLEFRCCMCPNSSNHHIVTCPGIPGTPHPEPSSCRFVKSYVDGSGSVYAVMGGPGRMVGYWKGLRFIDKSARASRFIPELPWRECHDDAQADLNALAKKNGWREWERSGDREAVITAPADGTIVACVDGKDVACGGRGENR